MWGIINIIVEHGSCGEGELLNTVILVQGYANDRIQLDYVLLAIGAGMWGCASQD